MKTRADGTFEVQFRLRPCGLLRVRVAPTQLGACKAFLAEENRAERWMRVGAHEVVRPGSVVDFRVFPGARRLTLRIEGEPDAQGRVAVATRHLVVEAPSPGSVRQVTIEPEPARPILGRVLAGDGPAPPTLAGTVVLNEVVGDREIRWGRCRSPRTGASSSARRRTRPTTSWRAPSATRRRARPRATAGRRSSCGPWGRRSGWCSRTRASIRGCGPSRSRCAIPRPETVQARCGPSAKRGAHLAGGERSRPVAARRRRAGFTGRHASARWPRGRGRHGERGDPRRHAGRRGGERHADRQDDARLLGGRPKRTGPCRCPWCDAHPQGGRRGGAPARARRPQVVEVEWGDDPQTKQRVKVVVRAGERTEVTLAREAPRPRSGG